MKNDDDKVAIRNAILTNTGIKIFFGGLDPDDAELIGRLLFTGYLDLAEWKLGSERPAATGSEKAVIANWSRADMQADSEMRARTHSHSRGTARGTTHSTSTASGSGTGSSDASAMVLTPPARLFGPNAPNATLIPVPLSQSVSQSTSESSFQQTSETSGETYTEIETESEADTTARGVSRGKSQSEGGSEVFVTRYDWLPSAMYSLAEQLHRVTGELMNLAPREVFVKIRGGRPFRARTADVRPAFRSAQFKTLMLPRFREAAFARSPYIRSSDQVDAEIAARFTPSLPPTRKSEPDSWGEPFDYPDPPPPPDAPRGKPALRIVQPDAEKHR